jgi:CRP-like cAMP-binding protein
MTVPLEQTSLVRLLGPERIEKIRPHVREKHFNEGEYLYFEGEDAEFLWAVGDGEVRTLRGSAAGRVTTLETLRRGDLFGVAALAPEGVYTEACQGVAEGRAWRVPRRVIAGLLRDDPEIARALLTIVAERLQRAHERLCSFAHDSVSARMARAVLEASPASSDPGDGRLETTRRLLGDSAGTTVETAIRVLRRFEKAGWIEGGIGWIRVVDRAALARVAAGDAP